MMGPSLWSAAAATVPQPPIGDVDRDTLAAALYCSCGAGWRRRLATRRKNGLHSKAPYLAATQGWAPKATLGRQGI